jgi:hypothetical protein
MPTRVGGLGTWAAEKLTAFREWAATPAPAPAPGDRRPPWAASVAAVAASAAVVLLSLALLGLAAWAFLAAWFGVLRYLGCGS